METSLNVTDYPSPPEPKEQLIWGTIHLSYDLDDYFPEDWDIETIKNEIKENLSDYINFRDYEDIEVDI